MNTFLTWVILILLVSTSACGPDQASHMLETAQFEERQTNKAHAKELYEDIIRHGTDILKQAGLLGRWETRHDRPCRVQWQDWRLVFEGKAYGPSSSCFSDWESGLWKDWKPTGKERSV